MPTLNQLRGLRASDRTEEEQKAINQQMGYKEEPEQPIVLAPQKQQPVKAEMPTGIQSHADTAASLLLNNVMRYKRHLDDKYEEALAERQKQYGIGHTNSVNEDVNSRLDSIANEISSYYKKYNHTDYLPLDNQEKKHLIAQYDARKQTYGEDNANIWLDNYFKDKVGSNQSWWEQGVHAISHLIPAIEGGAIQTYGMLHGAVAHILGAEGYDQNPDLNWWDSFINDVLDNPIMRYGRDVEMAGASNVVQGFENIVGISDETAAQRIANMKQTATRYNPEGIGEDAIVTTSEQDDDWLTSATPWQALQSGGFTALSMLTGSILAKGSQLIFGALAKGANLMNKTGRLIKTAKGLEKTLVGLKKAQNLTDVTLVPGIVGSVEGAMEGLNTKIDVEREAVQQLDDYYKDKVSKEAEELFNDESQNPMVQTRDGQYRRKMTPEDAFRQVWNKYQNQYTEARRQIAWASSKAGIHNFYANSLINGMLNTTLKAGLMAPRVQETLRNSKLTGWAYRSPKFNVDEAGNVTPKLTKLGAVKQMLKEPLGEGMEEYLQSLSNDTFSSAAENNINEFVKNKFEGDGSAKVTDSFGSDYAAALTALNGSLANKESIESAILGAVSSAMGTVGGIGRGYHRDSNGNLVRNSVLDPRNLTRSLTSKGEMESWMDYTRRVTPWRSGLVNAYFDRRKEQAEANETAATLTEWLKDPQNKAKWDGLVGTANWITQMENAAESNDQFSYRKAQMGKAINDAFMLNKLQGTDYYDTVLADLQRASSMDVSSQEAQNMVQQVKQNGGEEYQNKTDEEIIGKIQSNANRMLGLMSTIEQEGRNLDRLLGRVDEDTKQSLVFGKIMTQDFTQRRDQLQDEIDTIKSRIDSSRGNSHVVLSEDQKAIILKYGSLNKALKAQEELQKQKEGLEKHIEELEKIDPKKTSDKQKEDLVRSKKQQKLINRELQGFAALKDKDGNMDSSIATLVLNEEEIMNLDPVTRARVLAQGANKLYNALHQDRQKVDKLNLEIDDVQHQIDVLEAQKQQWVGQDGNVKKGHNKQYQRNTQKIAELQKEKDKKMRQLNVEQGKQDSKPIYSQAQQEVIDNLIQQGMAQDADFLDKVVDMGRLERDIKDYHTQYQAILSDPKAFQNYVQRAKYNAQRDLTRRRAERVSRIQNYPEYAQELDRLTANASQLEMREIMQTLMNEDAKQKRTFQTENGYVDENTGELVLPEGIQQPQTNYDRYMQNLQKQTDVIRQFAKNPNLTDNDMSLLQDALQYLSSKGVDVTDREAAVQTLIEKDVEGNIGGLFRQFVEAKNNMLPEQQRAFMPVFTSIGQVVSQYVDLLNGLREDAVNRGNLSPTIVAAPVQPQDNGQTLQSGQTQVLGSPTPTPSAPSQEKPQASTSTPEGGQFVDDDGTVATGSQTASAQQRRQQEQGQQEPEQKSRLRKLFEERTTPKIANMVDIASQMIDNSNVEDEEKALARQCLEDLVVDSDDRYETLDDLLTAIMEQINKLKEASNNEETDNNKFDKAAGLLLKVYASLNVKKMRGRRTLPMPSSRPENPKASWIHTGNIAYMEKVNPDAWAVQFTDQHAIDEWNRDHVIGQDTPVYFITDSEWTAEVTRQMQPTPEMLSINPKHRQYDTLTDMPIVAAVRVDTPLNPQSTTAVEVGGLWYQPIGIMPSTKAKNSGAELTGAIRKIASKEQGTHLVTIDGTPNAYPLTTRVYGVNYLSAHHPDASTQKRRKNSKDNNTDIIDDILYTLSRESEARLRTLSKEELLADSEYQEARAKFLNRLVWQQDTGNQTLDDQLTYVPDNRREGEKGNPILIITKPMAESVGRTTGKVLTEVLQDGNGEEVVNFNSRTQRAYHEVIRPIYQFLPMQDRNGDKSAKIITKDDLTANPKAYQDEADRLTKLLQGYENGVNGISDFIYVKPKSGWSIKVTAPSSLQEAGDMNTSQTVFKVFFVNQDSTIAPIELGTIRAGQRDTDSAMELLRNIMYDTTTGQVRDFLNWQVPKGDALNVNNPNNGNARRNIAAIVDDGILSLAGSSLVYDVDGVKLRAPITANGKVQYPDAKVANSQNAQAASPQNNTPQGEGAVVTPTGQTIEPDSGANLGNDNNARPTPSPVPQESQKLKKAKETTRRIVEDSKQFKLSEDETYYYIEDKTTGEQVKYLRVTTVIGADESTPQWTPTTKEIIDKLKERHSIGDLSAQQMAVLKDMSTMSKELGVPVSDIKRAIAELRTQHKKEKYGVWSVPSTAVGNTADTITRDFFANHLKEEYPNVTKEDLGNFVHQLEFFQNELDTVGIHIVPEGVMAHGKITMTDDTGNSHDVNVAGTLDLFGYDDEGNFYIFDMKTTRDHSAGKLQKEKDKWSRQISMYADLLRQTYPDFYISNDNLRIIPIDVNYPTPMGSKTDHLDPTGPQYTVNDEGQLLMAYRNTKAGNEQPFKGCRPTMRSVYLEKQFQPGYTPFNINWDNLSSEDQDIASALTTTATDTSPVESAPQNAVIETPKREVPSFISSLSFQYEESQDTQEPAPLASPVVANGEQQILPEWRKLSAGIKSYLADNWGVESLSDYNELLNNPAEAEACLRELKCHSLM